MSEQSMQPASLPPTTPSRRPSLLAGRVNRMRYLGYMACLSWGVGLSCSALWALAASYGSQRILTLSQLVFVVLGYFLLPLATLVLSVRRLHDLGRPGWFVLLFAVPIVNLPFLAWLALWPGRAEANDYGPPPAPAGHLLQLAVLLSGALVAWLWLAGEHFATPARSPSNNSSLRSYSP